MTIIKGITAKEIKKGITEQKIKEVKESLNDYTETLSEYAFDEVCNLAILYKKMWKDSLSRVRERIDNAKISEQDKFKERDLLWGFRDNNDKSQDEITLEYYQDMLNGCKNIMDSLDEKTKKKIVEKAISKKCLYSNQIKIELRVFEEIKKLEEESKNVKHKINKKGR